MEIAAWNKIKEAFDQVVEAPLDQRRALVDSICGSDLAFRFELEGMLAVDASGKVFDAKAQDLRNVLAADWIETAADATDTRIGSWHVRHELGRGGMGIVLLVERADGQYFQQGALKLIKRGMDSDAVLSRFLRERQILAQLEHRNIARLFDGGVTDDGWPYFVMEYVDGVPECPENPYAVATTSPSGFQAAVTARNRLFFGSLSMGIC